MKREILLLDVTAMQGGQVCVAGRDIASGRDVRLNQPGTPRWLVKQLGNLAPGDLISLDWRPSRRVERPHVEDGIWDPDSLKVLDRFELARLATAVAHPIFDGPVAAFGKPWQEGARGNHAWQPDRGERSLATVRARSLRIVRSMSGVRVELTDATDTVWSGVPFQDLRAHMHRDLCAECARALLPNLTADFSGGDVLVRIGLTRPFTPDDRPKACWLHVTNIFARERQHFI